MFYQMKYPYIICLILFLIIGSVNGSAQFVIHHSNFENNYSFISYSPQLNNVWQVGPTIKPFFGSSNSLPNAIMTDTINPYPINITSSFIIRLHQDVNYPPPYAMLRIARLLAINLGPENE